MNSSEPALMAKMRAALPVHLSFDWIEHVAVPVAISIMNTQPIALILFAGSALLTGQTGALALDAYSITLLLLGLLWWAMFVHQLIQHDLSKRHVHLLHAVGLLVAFIVMLSTHLSALHNFPILVIESVLLIWFWRRSIEQVRKGLDADYLIVALKQGFLVLLVALCFAIIPTFPAHSMLLMHLTFALPIFFLSSLIALSFTRLNVVRKDYLQRKAHVNPARRWLLVLFLLWGVLVTTTILLEIFAVPVVLTLLQPLWQAFVAFISGPILAFLQWLFQKTQSVQEHKRLLLKPPISHPQQMTVVHLNLLLIEYIVGLLVTLVVLFLLVRFFRAWMRRRKNAAQKKNKDEIREKLAARDIRKARRQERKRQRQASPALDALDSVSTRALYRKFLQALAWHGEDLGRHPTETPLEYQARLLLSLKPSFDTRDKLSPEPDILDALTRAYRQERYGGRLSEHRQQAYLQREVPRLIKQLTRRR